MAFDYVGQDALACLFRGIDGQLGDVYVAWLLKHLDDDKRDFLIFPPKVGTLEIPVHGAWRVAEGTQAPEEFPKVFFTVSSEDIASLQCQPTGIRATTQLRRLALSHLSIRRKRHESVMSLVMVLASEVQENASYLLAATYPA